MPVRDLNIFLKYLESRQDANGPVNQRLQELVQFVVEGKEFTKKELPKPKVQQTAGDSGRGTVNNRGFEPRYLTGDFMPRLPDE